MMVSKRAADPIWSGNSSKKLTGFSIARVSTVPFFVTTQLSKQIHCLARHGAIVVIVSSDGPELDGFDWSNDVSHLTIDIPRAISLAKDFNALLKLLYLFKSRRFKIVHSTTPKAGFLTAISSFLCRVPVRLHTFTGQPWVELSGIKKWLAVSCDILIGILSTHCYADSPSQKDFLIKMRIIKPTKISVIGDGSLAGVDIERFNINRFTYDERKFLRQSLGIPEDSLVIIFLGRITIDKGIVELLEAFKIAKDKVKKAHLLLVGPLDSKSSAIKSYGLSGQHSPSGVHFIGRTDSPELYLSIANLLCLPSYREGFGTVIIEAASMGIPSIGTKIYGLQDAIDDGKTGLLVSPKNIEELSAALIKLLCDKELRDKLGVAARLRVLEKFDANMINEKIVDDYCFRLKNLD